LKKKAEIAPLCVLKKFKAPTVDIQIDWQLGSSRAT
jgi:hypothetical protein